MEADGKLSTWCRLMIADPNYPNFKQCEDGSFHIPWLDQKRTEWREDDEYSRILHQYTLHFRPNEVEKKDYPKWKLRLRNALNKSNYIERLQHLDVSSGLTPRMVCKFKRQPATNDHSSYIDDLTNQFVDMTSPSHSQVNNYDGVLREPNAVIGQQFDDSNLDLDYEMLSEDSQSRERSHEFLEGMDVVPFWPQASDHLINGHGNVGQTWPQNCVNMNGHADVGQTWTQASDHLNGHVAHDEPWPHTYAPLDKPSDFETPLTSQSIEQLIQTLVGKRMLSTEITSEPVLIIDVLYDNPYKVVKTITLRADVPQCHLFAQTVQDQTLQNKIQGDRREIQFELPDVKSVPDISEKFKSKIKEVLKHFTPGVSIKYHNLNIFVQRRCTPPVSFSDDVSTTESLKRKRGAEEFDLIFDYKEFLNSLFHHMQHPDTPAPKDYVLLVIAGKYLVQDASPMRRVPMHLKIRHLFASQDLNDFSERRDVFDFSSMFSTMDSLDQEIKAAKDHEKNFNK